MITKGLLLDIAYSAKRGRIYSITTKASYRATPTKHVKFYMILNGSLMYMNNIFDEIVKRTRDKDGNFVLKGGGTDVISDYYWHLMEAVAKPLNLDKTLFLSIQELNI